MVSVTCTLDEIGNKKVGREWYTKPWAHHSVNNFPLIPVSRCCYRRGRNSAHRPRGWTNPKPQVDTEEQAEQAEESKMKVLSFAPRGEDGGYTAGTRREHRRL